MYDVTQNEVPYSRHISVKINYSESSQETCLQTCGIVDHARVVVQISRGKDTKYLAEHHV